MAAAARKLSILVVSWNGREHLETCLPAVQAQRAALDGEAGRGQAGREEQNREDDEAAAHGSSGR